MKLVDEIAEQMRDKTSEELISIYMKNDRTEWSDAAFEAVKQVLTERGVPVPQQATQPVPQQDIQPSISFKVGRLRSLGFVLAIMIVSGIIGWIVFPLCTAFGVGLAAAIDRKPGINPMTLAIGYYKVHSTSHAIIGAALGALTVMLRAARRKKI